MNKNSCNRVIAMAVCAALAAVASPVSAATTWKAEIWGAPRTSTKPFEEFAKEVAAKTDGQLKVEFSYNKSKSEEAVDLLKSGARDATYVCAGYFGDKMPLATVVDLPMFAPDSIPALGKVELALADHPAIQEELRKYNVKILIPAPLQQYQLMGTRRIATVEDLKGAKVRASPEMGKILEEYGASTQLIPSVEALGALRKGSIDMVGLPYPYAFAAFKIDEGSKYVTDKISLGTQLCYLGVNAKSFEALPPKVQNVVLSLRQPTVERYAALYAQDDAATIAAFKQKGIEFVAFSPVDRARLVAKSIKYWQAWIDEREKQGHKAREVFDFTQAKIREYNRK